MNSRSALRSMTTLLALAWIVVVLLMLTAHIFAGQRSGPLALTEVVEPYVVLTALIALPLALVRRTAMGSVVVAVLLLVVLGRYLPVWVSIPAGGPPRLTAATWNVLGGSDGARRTLEGVLAVNTDLVALVELQPAAAQALEEQPQLTARLPYRVLAPDPGLFGSGLLSGFPIVDQSVSTDPPYLRAQIELADAQTVVVYVIHAPPPGIRTLARLPIGLEAETRDATLDAIRAVVEVDVANGRTVLVAGDFNTTEREPAYMAFVHGLRDAHLDAGIGPGMTWRPEALNGLPFGVVRIDYLLTTPDMQAISTHVVCNGLSDHCLLTAEFK